MSNPFQEDIPVEYTDFTQVVPVVGAATDEPIFSSAAKFSLAALDAVILAAEPAVQIEVKYVEDRLSYLLAKHGNAAVYALMRANLKIAIDNGQ
jgi:predicted nucleic acid-binding protein